MKTYSTKASDINPSWRVFDATGQSLGRLASTVAQVLKGKHKPIYAPHLNIGDYVIVVNSAKVKITGNKMKQKTYYRHSGYPGGLKSISLEKLLQTRPNRVVEHAVRGMLPHGPLGRSMFRRLKVYHGNSHPHEAQIIHSQKVAVSQRPAQQDEARA